jgi:hypothetical protein
MKENIRIFIREFVQRLDEDRFKWTEDLIRQEASKYNSKQEFRKGSDSAYQRAYQLGILDTIEYNKK